MCLQLHPEDIVIHAAKDDEKVPSALVATDGGNGLEFVEVKVIVFEPTTN
jgi:hypothetical protein